MLSRPVCFCLLALFPLASFASDEAEVKKFTLPDSPIQLEGEPVPARYFDVAGRRAILMGREGGAMEAWIYPFKIAHNIGFQFRREDFARPLRSEELARRIVVRPESTSILFSHEDFSVTATFFVPLDEPAIVILLEVDTSRALTVAVSFTPDLKPMWPASLGGQYSFWSENHGAFILSESRRLYNALVGSPAASRHFATPAHRLADAPNRFEIDVTPEHASSRFIPVILCGGKMPREEAIGVYNRVLGDVEGLYQQRLAHARRLREELMSIETPDGELNLAFEWGKVSLDDGLACNPDLGCGLVAGFGLSGRSERPGFGWYFGGDTFYNCFSLVGYGDFAAARAALELIRRNQRADGKIMHELSQGAGFIRWFEEYPYGYYHLETSPYYIVAAWNYVLASGDLEFLRESWPSLLRAFRYSETTETDGDGLVENSEGGLGALEVGVLLKDLKTDIYVAGLWVESMRCLERMAELLGEREIIEEIESLKEKAEASLSDLFFDPQRGYHALALAADGTAVSELTAWPAVPMIFGLFPDEEAEATLRRLAGSEIATDWGVRMLTRRSDVYEPTAYNNGAVWPFVTGYVAMAQYQYHRPEAGWQLIQALAALTFEDSRGDIAELYSGDFHRPLDAAVPHQLFSTGGLIAPVVRGLLGLHPDAFNRILTFAPQIPVEWDRLRLKNVPLGAGCVQIEYERKGNLMRYRFWGGGEGWTVRFRPGFPVGTSIGGVKVNGREQPFRVDNRRSAVVLECELPLDAETLVEVELERMEWLVLPGPESTPGQRALGLRYIDSWLDVDDGTIFYELAGRSGRDYIVKHHSYPPACGSSGNVGPQAVLKTITFPSSEGIEFQRVIVALRYGKLWTVEKTAEGKAPR